MGPCSVSLRDLDHVAERELYDLHDLVRISLRRICIAQILYNISISTDIGFTWSGA